MNISFMQTAAGDMRIRVHQKEGSANDGGFDFQVDLTAAQWITLLTAVGADGAHAGTASVPAYTPDGKSAGELASNDMTT
jgi:hypothetical protein